MNEDYEWDPEAARAAAEADPAFVHHHNEFGCTPLMNAAAAGDDALVAFLLDRGADPNAPGDDDFPTLSLAVESEREGATAALVRLLAAGADLHADGMYGWTALHLAANRGFVGKCRVLLDAGAEIDRRDTFGDGATPLMEAAESGKAEVVRLLLDRGADASLRGSMRGETALELARGAARGHDPAVYSLLKAHLPRLKPPETLADVEGPNDENRARMISMLANLDPAEHYREQADRRAAEGRYDEVIRMLEEHEGRRGWRRWFRR